MLGLTKEEKELKQRLINDIKELIGIFESEENEDISDLGNRLGYLINGKYNEEINMFISGLNHGILCSDK